MRVCAPLMEKRGDSVVCLTQSRLVLDGFKKPVSPRYWFTHIFYSSSFVAPLGFQSRALWCTELESPALPTSHRLPNFRMRLHQAAFIRLYTAAAKLHRCFLLSLEQFGSMIKLFVY